MLGSSMSDISKSNETEAINKQIEIAAKKVVDYFHDVNSNLSHSKDEFKNEEDIKDYVDSFKNKFSPDKLKVLQGEDLLKLFYTENSDSNKTNSLCYALEHGDNNAFGSIRGYVGQFYLHQNQKTKKWRLGNDEISESEAVKKAQEIIDKLCSAYHVIEEFVKLNNLDSIDDYTNLDSKLKDPLGKLYNNNWIQKYFSILFFDKKIFSCYYSEDWQKHILYALGIRPKDDCYIRNGQIAIVAKLSGLSHQDFYKTLSEKFGELRRFYLLGTTEKSNNTKYSYAPEFIKKHVAAIGWNKIGNLEEKYVQKDKNNIQIDKDSLIKELIAHYQYDTKVASRKTKEITSFYKTGANDIFVAKDGRRLLGFIDNLGEYEYRPDLPFSHTKKGTWHFKFDNNNNQLEETNEGYLTTCKQIKNDSNLLFLYDIYFNGTDKIPEDLKVNIDYSNQKNQHFVKELKILHKKKNMILQGAPGTGKTYSTALLAVGIIDEDDSLDYSDYNAVVKKYEAYKKGGLIEFTTFHQSLDYEDFIEGLVPEVISSGEEGENSSINYKATPGIFKRICDNAINSGKEQPKSNFDVVWSALINYLNENDFLEIPLERNESKKFKIELNQSGDGLINRYNTKGELTTTSKYFTKAQLFNIYNGKPGVPEGGHDNYRRAIVKYLKTDDSSSKLNVKLDDNITVSKSSKKHNYVLIIDEINRGNVAKIFGELITLLEADKREFSDNDLISKGIPDTIHTLSIPLKYLKDEFGKPEYLTVPSNLYIIGTMNTTDRSVGSIDYALRRRFTFVTIKADPKVIENYYSNNSNLQSKALNLFNNVNKFIEDNKACEMDLEDLKPGHSYYLASDEDELAERWNYEILPLLLEYYNDGLVDKSPKDLVYTDLIK